MLLTSYFHRKRKKRANRFFCFFFFSFIIFDLGNLASSDGTQRRYNGLQTNSAYSANELWFKAATIIFPIFGAVILVALIALAIRILKTDNFHATTGKSAADVVGNGMMSSSQRKPEIDAYASASTALNIESGDGDQINCQTLSTSNTKPLLMLHTNHIDIKNEHFAQKNHISSLAYHLLPQNCYDTTLKPNNLDTSRAVNVADVSATGDADNAVANHTNNLFRILVNFNYSPLQSNNNRTAFASNDINSKIYEKNTINPTNYWMLSPNTIQCAAEK